ncbi:hypothetical protein F8M41_003931 [Gigaspora margarita]|uniref:Uncharacterized protein n=1 Tax=Gigaspora margarita TaxID=4874 RepID=A0A8H4A727_GIGMA|nr:hypothetical protein F8M41_003931 [Gigaspora margarita]
MQKIILIVIVPLQLLAFSCALLILFLNFPLILFLLFLLGIIIILIRFDWFLSQRTLEEEISIQRSGPLPFEVPDCFKVRGLEEDWADLIKDGKDFRQEDWYRTHIIIAKREGITPFEHLAKFLKRVQEESDSDKYIEQEEHQCSLVDRSH